MSTVQVKITAGLVALVMFAGFFASLCIGVISPKVEKLSSESNAPPVVKPHRHELEPLEIPRVDVGVGTLPQPEVVSPPINRPALDEIKRAGGYRNFGGQPLGYKSQIYQPTEESEISKVARAFNGVITKTDSRYHVVLNSQSLVWNATNHRSTNGYVGELAQVSSMLLDEMKQGTRFASVTPPTPKPTPVAPVDKPSPIVDTPPDGMPKTKGFDLALFLDGSPRSQELRQWFETDRDLRAIRDQCNFQIYTPENPTYRTRLTHIVSTNNFPALVLTYADGGHIHAAAEKFIPTTAPKLAADLYYFAKLAKTARDDAKSMGLTSQTIGLMKQTTGYSWDKMISPSLQLQDENGQCPDGRPCPTPTPNTPNIPNIDTPSPNSDGTLIDRLNKDAIVLTGPRDYMALGIIVCLVLALLVARNRGII